MLKLQQKRKEKLQQLIDVREAFNLWGIVKSKYDILEFLELFQQFVHDKDLKLIFNDGYKFFTANKNKLEDLLQRYSVMGPELYRGASYWSGNSEAIRDEFAATCLLIYLQEHIENMLRASRTSVTNDYLRSVIVKMLKQTIRKTNKLYKYLKIKGWIDTPPLYPNSPSGKPEIICCASAAHLWDHLTSRYDNLRQTKMFSTFTNDGDFKLMIDQGILILNKQIDILEEECKQFGITLPKRPPEVIVAPEGKEMMKDDYIYRVLLAGFQGAGQMHAEAIKQVTHNDRIRNIFIKMLMEEINYYEFFVRYGKIKGWLHPAPAYRI